MVARRVDLTLQFRVDGPALRASARPSALAEQPTCSDAGEKGGREQQVVQLLLVVTEPVGSYLLKFAGVETRVLGNVFEIRALEQRLQRRGVGSIVQVSKNDDTVLAFSDRSRW